MPTPAPADTDFVVSAASNTTSLVSKSFTGVAVGDIFVITVESESRNQPTIGAATGGSETYTARIDDNTASNTAVKVFTATSTSTTSRAITVAFSGTAGYHSMAVYRFSQADHALDVSPVTNLVVGSTTVSSTITTVNNNSTIVGTAGDWNAIAPGTTVYRSSGVAVGVHNRSPSEYTGYHYYIADAGTAGSKTYGISTPTGMKATMSAIEIKAVGGTNASPPVSTVVGATTVPTPAVSTSTTVTATSVDGSTSIPVAAAHGGATPTPATVAGQASVPTPTLNLSATVHPATVGGTSTVPASAVTAGGSANVPATTVAGAASVPTPTVSTIAGLTKFYGFTDTDAAGLTSGGDNTQLALGTKFQIATDTDLYAIGVRVWNIGTAWVSGKTAYAEVQSDANADTALDTVVSGAQVSYTSTGSETAGWQEFLFATPVLLSPGVTYAPVMRTPTQDTWTYPVSANKFTVNIPFPVLTDAGWLEDGTDGFNGDYSYGALDGGDFPNKGFNKTWYGVDIILGQASGTTSVHPATVGGAASVPTAAAGVVTSVTVTPTTVGGAASVPSLTGDITSTITATAVTGAASIPTPTVAAQASATVTPGVVMGAATVPTPMAGVSTSGQWSQWDGLVEHPLTVDGEWTGVSIRQITLAGRWDGSVVA